MVQVGERSAEQVGLVLRADVVEGEREGAVQIVGIGRVGECVQVPELVLRVGG